jgi:hypothetical protein
VIEIAFSHYRQKNPTIPSAGHLMSHRDSSSAGAESLLTSIAQLSTHTPILSDRAQLRRMNPARREDVYLPPNLCLHRPSSSRSKPHQSTPTYSLHASFLPPQRRKAKSHDQAITNISTHPRPNPTSSSDSQHTLRSWASGQTHQRLAAREVISSLASLIKLALGRS